MFKNFHEHYESPEESGTGSELIVFNTKYDRIKLLLSAILIPVACSFLYFLVSGHKYAELETAIGDIEIAQEQSVDESLVDDDLADKNLDDENSDNGNQIAAANDEMLQTADNSTVLTATSPNDLNDNSQKQSTQDVDDLAGIDSVDENLQDITEVDINAAVALETQNIQTGIEDDDSLDNRAVSPEMNDSEFSELLPGRNLAELAEFLIPDNKSETTTESGHEVSFSGRGQAEIALLVKTQNNPNTLQSTQNNTIAISGSGIDTQQDMLINDTDKNDSLTNDNIDRIEDQNLESRQLLTNFVSKNDPSQHLDTVTSMQLASSNIDIAKLSNKPGISNTSGSDPGTLSQLNTSGSADQTTDSGLIIIDTVAGNNNDTKHQEEQARIVMVDKIIGLLKSEVISTNATADTGKHKRLTNRHSVTNKKSYNINKLESILEDI